MVVIRIPKAFCFVAVPVSRLHLPSHDILILVIGLMSHLHLPSGQDKSCATLEGSRFVRIKLPSRLAPSLRNSFLLGYGKPHLGGRDQPCLRSEFQDSQGNTGKPCLEKKQTNLGERSLSEEAHSHSDQSDLMNTVAPSESKLFQCPLVV